MARDMADETDRAWVEALLVELRPALHRYAARMVGSVLDGEDVVQDAIARAMAALDRAPPEGDATAWTFRIAHNAAIDHLRARARRAGEQEIQEEDMVSDGDEPARRFAAGAALAVFMHLPPLQRGTVILKDVLGYSNEEAAGILDTTLAATKAALHRGRARLRILADAPTSSPPADHGDLIRLQTYVDRFNARDFDAIRAMIADDVRLDLVSKTRMRGKVEVSRYFGNYAKVSDWHLVPGLVEGRPAILVFDPNERGSSPKYFMLLDWSAGQVATIRDFRHAPYVIDGAEYLI